MVPRPRRTSRRCISQLPTTNGRAENHELSTNCVGPQDHGEYVSRFAQQPQLPLLGRNAAGAHVVGASSASTTAERTQTALRTLGIWSESVLAAHAVIALSDRVGQWKWLGQHPHPISLERGIAAAVMVWDHLEVGSAHVEAIQLSGHAPELLVLLGQGARALAKDHRDIPAQWCWEPGDGVDRLRALLADLTRPGRESPELSVQESRVLHMCAEGLKVAAIARRLDVSPHTVHTYLRRMRRKFAAHGRPVSSQLELYRVASEWGLLANERSVG